MKSSCPEEPQNCTPVKATSASINTVLALRRDLSRAYPLIFMDKLVELSDYYKGKYDDWKHTHLYHLMIGSSLPEEFPLHHADFPGEDSVLLKLQQMRSEIRENERVANLP